MRLAGFVLAAIMTAGAAHAADDAAVVKDPVEARYTPAYGRCMDSADGQSTMGMIGCIGAETQVQDGALNAAYRKAMKDLNPRQKAKLQAAQRAWIAFRDAECASFLDEDWGSLSRINANDCFLHMTAQRVIDLENYPPGT
jgi:uncharacterized protein YecT (DUF1311 family)